MSGDAFSSDSGAEQIFTSALVPAPLGNYDEGLDPYNNAVVYFFAFFGCLIVAFGFVAIGVASYRMAKHRPHATRGLVVAIVATLIGIAVSAAAISQM